MHLTPLAAAAIQLPLLVAATAALLRGPRAVRWLRLVVLGLGWLIVDALVAPLVGSAGVLFDAPLVSSVTAAGLIVSLFAAAYELHRASRATVPAVGAIVALGAGFVLAPEPVVLGLALASWVGGTLLLGWTFSREARQHPGSLLEARLRLLAGGSWLLAAAALGVVGGPTPVVAGLPMVTGTLIIVLAVAPPPFVRLALARTRETLRHTETELAAVGKDEPEALHEAVRGVCTLFGADAALLVDDGEVVAEVGDDDALAAARAWSAAPDTDVAATGHELVVCGDHWLLAGDTSRGEVVVVLSSVGVLLSRTDREQVESIADRLGVVLTREEARRADERAAASMRAAERMRDDMLSTLSHELRTPLTSIMGFAEVLRKHAGQLSPDQVNDMLDRLVQRGLELEMVVSALLDLTAVRGRSEPGRIAVYELRDLVEQSVRRAEELLSGRGVEVTGDVGVVHSDGGAILAVLEELLENAAAYTPDGSPLRLVLGTRAEDVVVEVIDEGPGLGELGPAGVFYPFVRGGDVMTRDTRGVGIGLTIARELASQLGGSLTALDIGSGSVFRLRFPRRHGLAQPGTDQSPLSAEHAAGDPTLVPSGRRGDVPYPVRGASSVGPAGAAPEPRADDEPQGDSSHAAVTSAVRGSG